MAKFLIVEGQTVVGVIDLDVGDVFDPGAGRELVPMQTTAADTVVADDAITTPKIVDDAVTNAKLANVATATFKGRTTAGTGDPEDLTQAQATALLNAATASLQGAMSAADKVKTDKLRQVRVATVGNITLSGTQTIDTIALSVGDRVLVKDQTTASENGIYDVASGAWARSSDSDASAEFTLDLVVFVGDGYVNKNSVFFCQTASPTLGVTAIVWNLVARDFHEHVYAPARAASTVNLTLSGTQTIDGVSVVAGERVLAKNQSTGSENGIYVVAAGAWSRFADFSIGSGVHAGTFVPVTEGTTQADTTWELNTNGTIVIGTTSLSFTRISMTAAEQTKLSNLVLQRYRFGGPDFDDPVNANWAVNAMAALAADTVNAALSVRRFDGTAEEGVGFEVYIPTGAVSVTFRLISRAQTAPGSPQNVQPALYVREILDNAAVEAWSAATDMVPVSMPANTNWQYDSETIALSTLSLVAGRIAQFEMTRQPADADDTLAGDWVLLQLVVEFT